MDGDGEHGGDNRAQALWTPHQVAVRLGLSVRTVQQYASDGRLPGALRVGVKLWRFNIDAVNRWIERGRLDHEVAATKRAAGLGDHPRTAGFEYDPADVALLGELLRNSVRHRERAERRNNKTV